MYLVAGILPVMLFYDYFRNKYFLSPFDNESLVTICDQIGYAHIKRG